MLPGAPVSGVTLAGVQDPADNLARMMWEVGVETVSGAACMNIQLIAWCFFVPWVLFPWVVG